MAAIMENPISFFQWISLWFNHLMKQVLKKEPEFQEPEQLACFITKTQHTLKRDFVRVYDCQAGLRDYKEAFFNLEKQSLRGKTEFPKILLLATNKAKSRIPSRGLPSQPKGSGEGSAAGAWIQIMCTGFIIRSFVVRIYVPPQGSDSDLRAQRVRSHCSRPVHAARCACSLHIWFSEQDLTGFKLQNPETTYVSHNTFPTKLDIHNRRHEFWVTAFYLANRRVQIMKSIPEQNTLHPGEISWPLTY